MAVWLKPDLLHVSMVSNDFKQSYRIASKAAALVHDHNWQFFLVVEFRTHVHARRKMGNGKIRLFTTEILLLVGKELVVV